MSLAEYIIMRIAMVLLFALCIVGVRFLLGLIKLGLQALLKRGDTKDPSSPRQNKP